MQQAVFKDCFFASFKVQTVVQLESIMRHSVTKLETEFAHDHRSLTRGFAQIMEALRQDDWTKAVQLATDLNQHGGPHISFEERVLYPIVRMSLGEEYVRNLYDEHDIAIDALRDLISHPSLADANEERKQYLLKMLQTGLDHAVSCGSLLSHLTVLDETTQEHLLDELHKSRIEGKSMLELKP
mgnify:CR=1 FL=1